ncbi:MAG: hypothetical protein K9J16_08520 [Melioribacteraceae bacterium]|nr:hypothetical protein [Melioribacteraceae bacterium]MCF8353812.1 hypothetical protein [Melioribacteraceae bacterium]MCF8393648.1 hypothetical protein [Melioribacteraceae bacterium]MCF8419458.1 hypothetical protein [Melioribacteraceae bacterium]
MWNDPIVEEVRKHRKEIEKECKGDFSLLFSEAKKIEKKFKVLTTSKARKKRVTRKSKETA